MKIYQSALIIVFGGLLFLVACISEGEVFGAVLSLLIIGCGIAGYFGNKYRHFTHKDVF